MNDKSTTDESGPLKFCPSSCRPMEYSITAALHRAKFRSCRWNYNPWTGERRDEADVDRDPQSLRCGERIKRHDLTPVQQLHFAARVLREHGHNGDAYSVEQIAARLETPIGMVLHCPACLEQHIDEPEQPPAADLCAGNPEDVWANPPHRSHLCKNCCFIWRPADVATNGVAEIKTRGKDDMVLIDGPLEVMRGLRAEAQPKLDWDGERP